MMLLTLKYLHLDKTVRHQKNPPRISKKTYETLQLEPWHAKISWVGIAWGQLAPDLQIDNNY